MEYENIDIDKIDKGYNPRLTADIKELKQSIEQHGILVPLLVRPTEKGYSVVSGNCRLNAAKELKLKTVPCSIKTLSDEDAANISYIDNKQRNNLSAYEESKHYAYMRDTFGYSAQQLADIYNCQKSRVGEYWRIAKLPQTFSQKNDMGWKHLYELSKLLDRDALLKCYEQGYAKTRDKWGADEVKEYDKEVSYRENIMRDVANELIENESTVKEAERIVRDWVARFNVRDDNIKKQQQEKAEKLLKSITDGVSEVTTTFYNFDNGCKTFIDVSNMISKEFLKVIREDKKDDLIQELVELQKALQKFEYKIIVSEIYNTLQKLGVEKNDL